MCGIPIDLLMYYLIQGHLDAPSFLWIDAGKTSCLHYGTAVNGAGFWSALENFKSEVKRLLIGLGSLDEAYRLFDRMFWNRSLRTSQVRKLTNRTHWMRIQAPRPRLLIPAFS